MDVAFDSHQGADTGHHPAPRSFICGPLPGSPGMLGVLYVDHPEGSALTSDDLEVFLALTRHASALLNHATATWRSFAEARLRDRLLLHHPPTVVAQLLESAAHTESGREARIHEVTLLAASVTVRDRRPAAEALQAVTHAFTLLCDAAFAEDGSLIRFDGDIALFVFGAPLTAGDHADRALRAAEAMWQTLGALAPGPGVTIRIAIDTGPAITATIDSAGRHEHVVLGDVLRTVLSASGTRAEPGLILLTSRTRNRLSSPPALQSVGTAGSIPVELFGHRISVGTRDE
jgi:class 3 adenylate cyclase